MEEIGDADMSSNKRNWMNTKRRRNKRKKRRNKRRRNSQNNFVYN